MRRSLVLAGALLALGASSTPSTAAKKPKPVPCAGRYVVRSGGDALTADSTPAPATVVVQGNQIGAGSHCPLRKGTVHATTKATKLMGRWPTCGSAFKSAALNASISSDCKSMTGTFRAKKLKSQGFQARKSECGDGVFDAGNNEACDGGGCPGGQTCTTDCRCVTPDVTPTTTTTTITPTTSTHAGTTGVPTTTTSTTTDTTTTTVDLCGNHNLDPGEECDDGNHDNGDGCDANCTLPGCGNGIRDDGESCDDGDANGTPGDPCPAGCVIAACDPVTSSTRSFDVSFTPPQSKSAAGVSVLLDYPEGKVVIPGSGNDGNVVASISKTPFGASSQPNDTDWALTMVVAKGTAITPGRLFEVKFQDCADATPPTPADFTCTVFDASDPNGNVLNGVTCAVTAVP